MFGTDYVATEREHQAALLRSSLVNHLHKYPESVLVVEGALPTAHAVQLCCDVQGTQSMTKPTAPVEACFGSCLTRA